MQKHPGLAHRDPVAYLFMMPRAPFQVLILPFRFSSNGEFETAVFKRQPDDGDFWQFVSGGGEDDESPLEAALRELREETGLFLREMRSLKSYEMIPASVFRTADWGSNITEVPEHCFAIEVDDEEIVLSEEHTEFRWVSLAEALELLYWESNRAALRELFEIIGA